MATLGLTKPASIDPPQIQFSAKESDFAEWKGDILAIVVSEKDMTKGSDSKFENAILKKLDEKLSGLIAEASSEEDFTGKAGQSTVLRLSGLGFKRLGLVGLGSYASISTSSAFRSIGEAVASAAKGVQASSAAVVIASSDEIPEESKLKTASAIASGVPAKALKFIAERCFNRENITCKAMRGGYNIKTGPGCSIELMKFDMGGSAAAFGAAKAIGQIKPPGVEVHFIVAACENMISGTGMRPGDIVTASNGKTIEVNNTDAEGRLTLADALVYACNQGVEKIVDLATLTGACVVALGPSIAGIFTPNDDLAKEIVTASEVSGEKLWRLPMEESYWESMKSGVADMVNTGGRPGGSITAALFLKQFVNEKVQWLHIDMAGPVWSEKKRGATGFGVSTLVEWVLSNSS